MNKGSSVVSITAACILFILVFGVYIERDTAKTFYASPFVSNRAIIPPAMSNGITQSGTDSDNRHREIEPVGIIRRLGQSQSGMTDGDKHTVQLDESGTIRTPIHRQVIDKKYGTSSGEESRSQTNSLAQSTNKSSIIKQPADDDTTTPKSRTVTKNYGRKEYVVIDSKYPPGLSADQQVIQRQIEDLYKKNGRVPPKIFKAQKTSMHGRLTMTSHLQTQGPSNWRNLPAKLYEQAPVIFDTVPRKFLPQFKNPCWYTTNKQLLCLPYFYIIGFPKAGTTDLWDKINNHPQVSRTRSKETHFWRDHKIGKASSFLSYMSNAMFLNHRLLNGENEVVYGDGSATTVISHARFVKYFPNVTAGMYTNVDIIKEITPAAKMIISIREPAERLYSGYLYHPMKERRSVAGFHQEVLQYLAAFKRCRQNHPELRCIFEKNSTEGRAQRLKTGIYEPYIRSWVEGFGFDQIMIVRLEDWKTGCREILPQIFEFLELAPQKKSSIERLCVRHTRNQSTKHIGPMLSYTRQILENFYAPYNLRLSNLLNTTVYASSSYS